MCYSEAVSFHSLIDGESVDGDGKRGDVVEEGHVDDQSAFPE